MARLKWAGCAACSKREINVKRHVMSGVDDAAVSRAFRDVAKGRPPLLAGVSLGGRSVARRGDFTSGNLRHPLPRGSKVTCDVGAPAAAADELSLSRRVVVHPVCLVRALPLDCLYSLCGRIAALHSPRRLLQHPKITSTTPIDAFAHLLYTTAHNVYPGSLRHCCRRGQRRGGR